MITNINPPWVYPTEKTVVVFDKNKKRYIKGYYCFVSNTWKDLKGSKITIIGWKER